MHLCKLEILKTLLVYETRNSEILRCKDKYSEIVSKHVLLNMPWYFNAVFTVSWANMNMVDAERRLLTRALLDPSNGFFVLLSDTSWTQVVCQIGLLLMWIGQNGSGTLKLTNRRTQVLQA